MKKNILFVVDEQRYGGVSKVLVNILNAIDYTDKNIDVLILHNVGKGIKENIPDVVNIISGTSFFNTIDINFKNVVKSKNIINIFNKIKLIAYMKTGIIIDKLKKERKKLLNKEYDVEIAFKDGFSVLFASAGNSKKKISWLHTDYEKFDCTRKYKKLFNKVYKNNIDTVVAITNDVKKEFNNIYDCNNKTIVIENLIDDKEVIKLGEIENPYEKSENLNFVWVRTII